MKFQEFNLHPKVAAGVDAEGYTTPTPIHAQGIPSVMAGQDVMGLAQTGTGKTAAFSLPLLSRLDAGKARPGQSPDRRSDPGIGGTDSCRHKPPGETDRTA